jgi:hypothetical protein
MPPAACGICGVLLETSKRKYCEDCLVARRREQAAGCFEKAGPSALHRMRIAGRDPSHGGLAARKRAAMIAQRNRECAEWDRARSNPPDVEYFWSEIQPRLREISLSEMMRATGLSLRYCSLIRRGLYVPHPRHWTTLQQVVALISGSKYDPGEARSGSTDPTVGTPSDGHGN